MRRRSGLQGEFVSAEEDESEEEWSEEEDEMAGIIADFVAAIENGATVLDDYAPAAHNPVDDGALQVCLRVRATASKQTPHPS